MATTRPALSEKAVGHIRRIARLSQLPPGEWAGMGSDWWDIGERALQYQLAFGAYTLGLVQFHYTPAYRELCQTTLAALIQKMTLPDIWEKWIFASRGGSTVDPDQTELAYGWLDPVKKYNVMLKGHLLQMGALYEALYHDDTHGKPGAYTFEFKASTWGMGRETFKYSLHDIARIVHQEYVESNYEGCQCEPNRVYPMCNQHAVLGLIHYDHAYGTGYAADVMPKFKAAWLRKGYTDPETKSHMRMRFVRQDRITPADTPWSDGWTGIFMHAWDPEFIESLYPAEKKRHIENLLTGKDAERVYTAMVPTGPKLGFGMFAGLASEVGDIETSDKLLAYADRNFNPVWSEGEYYYPRRDEWKPDASGNYHGVDTLTGNALLALARIGLKDGLLQLYRNPPTKSSLQEPYITGVDQSATGVSQAYYDDQGKMLHVALLPGPKPSQMTGFEVRQLKSERTYSILKDGHHLAKLERGHSGMTVIKTDNASPHSFTVAEES